VVLAIFAAELVPQAIKDLQSSESALGNLVEDLVPGGTGSITDLFIAAMGGFFGLVITGGVLQTIMRLRQEEAAGHAESVLATRVGRLRWLGSFVLLATVAAVSIALLGGLLAGLTGARVDDPADLGRWLAALPRPAARGVRLLRRVDADLRRGAAMDRGVGLGPCSGSARSSVSSAA
jgi:putative exporter of polyketide antibiotics